MYFGLALVIHPNFSSLEVVANIFALGLALVGLAFFSSFLGGLSTIPVHLHCIYILVLGIGIALQFGMILI